MQKALRCPSLLVLHSRMFLLECFIIMRRVAASSSSVRKTVPDSSTPRGLTKNMFAYISPSIWQVSEPLMENVRGFSNPPTMYTFNCG